MAERETKELTTAGGHKIVYFATLTGREVLGVIRKERTGNETSQNVDKALDLIKATILSVDGATENVVELVQDLSVQDYLEISNLVASLSGNFPKAK